MATFVISRRGSPSLTVEAVSFDEARRAYRATVYPDRKALPSGVCVTRVNKDARA
jgi:hypothetical protein